MQSYLMLCIKGNPNLVLIAQKTEFITRIDGNEIRPTVANFAGQWVIPGGKNEYMDDGKYYNDIRGRGYNDKQIYLLGARREFYEETGIRVYDSELHPFIFVIRAYSKLFTDPRGIPYSISYVSVLPNRQQLIQNTINTNIINENQLDDELQIVEWVAVAEADRRFKDTSPVVSSNLYVTEQSKQLRDWFYNDYDKFPDELKDRHNKIINIL